MKSIINFSNPELVSFGEFGLVRDQMVQHINISPVRFNPANNEIQLLTKVVFQINFAQANNLSRISKSDLTEGFGYKLKNCKRMGNREKIIKKINCSKFGSCKW